MRRGWMKGEGLVGKCAMSEFLIPTVREGKGRVGRSNYCYYHGKNKTFRYFGSRVCVL
jgi:hypothetical protein